MYGKYVDIHSHVLPHLDDGSENTKMSLNMMRIAQAEGIRTIIATPHNMPGKGRGERERIFEEIARLQKKAEEEGINVRLKPGSELYYREELAGLLMSKTAVTMNGTEHVLVEFEPVNDSRYIINALKNIINIGYTPIVAHVERYPVLLDRKLEQIGTISDMGCYVQVNASTITGSLGMRMRLYAEKLLREQLVDFIGTDAHSDGRRSPRLLECAKVLYKKCEKSYADSMLFGLAEDILL